MKNKKLWIPDILYSDTDDSVVGNFPFVKVPKDLEMPESIIIFECRESGEFEPDSQGNEVPIEDFYAHQYVDMESIKRICGLEILNKIRIDVGLKPLTK